MSTPEHIVTVSQLNKQVKGFLEHEIGIVHVEGEVSNLNKPQSGHFYFTLKDDAAQIRCVFFKNRHHNMQSTSMENGQHLIASGRLSLYEARGDYQLIVEQVIQAGLGKLYQQFENLKKKLALEGLFHPDRKRKLPFIPKAIGIITSASGAAIRDMLSTLARRFPLATVFIYPCEVQGIQAPNQLIKALQRANHEKRCDVLILARGGGSIEDLWAFNDEALARTIAASDIPIVSGVGHETDFTIADFVADVRAETPTAAANLVTPDALELLNTLSSLTTQLYKAIITLVQTYQVRLTHLIEKIDSPRQTILTFWQTLDSLTNQLQNMMMHLQHSKTSQLNTLIHKLSLHNPKNQVFQASTLQKQLQQRLIQLIQQKLESHSAHLRTQCATLHAVSPLATLDRGYALASSHGDVIHNVTQVKIGEIINVRLARGQLDCEVLSKQE